MNLRPRTAAVIPALPTLLTLPLCGALTAAGLLPWSVPLSVAIALALLTLVRRRRAH
ncbi:hypothetical protein IPZ58_20275 [Streptomyces roseoverticillatus]|uniref:hypothetical protein n=1 Tax=Streptomyces roseoverticillatus TaxID=66429 RepID=UPI001F254D53|nr:hypothetical protein [Streptomyces roseoverticillatus]MCF3103908.1 hypothetical protein [Streptomyces roseoverticillatus]